MYYTCQTSYYFSEIVPYQPIILIPISYQIIKLMECPSLLQTIDLMHDDAIRPKGSAVVVVKLKSKMAASSASSGDNSKNMWY